MKPRVLAIALCLAALLAPATLSSVAAAAAAGERPTSGDCDATGVVVCAGANVGANVACSEPDAQGAVGCAWTYGWITSAFSPIGLGGAETHVAAITTTVCVDGEPCSAGSEIVERACAWTAASSCDDSMASQPQQLTAQLALGQCIRVSVELEVAIEAEAPEGALQLGRVAFATAGRGDGAACFVDNGR